MALTNPFINTFSSFDANVGTNIYMCVLGGSAITHYSFSLYDNYGSQVPFYTSERFKVDDDIAGVTIRTFDIQLLAQIGNIQNNENYKISATTYIIENDTILEQREGQTTLFSCYVKPSIKLSYKNNDNYIDLPTDDSQIILPFSINDFKLTFNKVDNNSVARPNKGKITLYGTTDSGARELITESETLYSFSFDGILNYETTTKIGGMVINVDGEGNLLPYGERMYESYEIDYACTTIDNVEINETIKNVNCYYPVITNSSFVHVNNLCNDGVVEINCDVRSLMGVSNVVPKYIDGQELDLRSQSYGGTEAFVVWAQQFAFNQPYTLKMWVKNLQSGDVCKLTYSKDVNKYIKIKYNIESVDNDIYGYLSLESSFGTSNENIQMHPYYVETDRILVADLMGKSVYVAIQQQDGLFDLEFKIIN